MSLISRRCLSRVRGIQAMVEEWRCSAHPKSFVPDLELLVSECLETADICVEAWKPLSEMLRVDPNTEEVEFAGQMLKRALKMLEGTINELNIAITIAKKQEQSIERADELDRALKDICELSHRLDQIFLTYDPVEAEEARAAFLRGEYITTEELLRELQGSSVSAD